MKQERRRFQQLIPMSKVLRMIRKMISPHPGEEALQITPEGERAIAQLWSVVEQSENGVLSGFSAQEKEQLLSYLKRIQANCATITQG
jgi:DNA-binding MarR family transcriptional regulator